MEMTKKTNLETNLSHANFKVGDTFTFKMTDGEKIGAIAVKEDANGNMLFVFKDCLKDKYPMYDEYNEDGYGSYEESDLRRHLNNEIYNKLPKEIKEKMVAFNNGDYLRLPTEKEIFGINEYGEKESADVEQFECMKQRKNRIAFQGYGSDT